MSSYCASPTVFGVPCSEEEAAEDVSRIAAGGTLTLEHKHKKIDRYARAPNVSEMRMWP